MSYFDLVVIGRGYGILVIYDLWLYILYDCCHSYFFQLGTAQYSASIITVTTTFTGNITAFLPVDLVVIITIITIITIVAK